MPVERKSTTDVINGTVMEKKVPTAPKMFNELELSKTGKARWER